MRDNKKSRLVRQHETGEDKLMIWRDQNVFI